MHWYSIRMTLIIFLCLFIYFLLVWADFVHFSLLLLVNEFGFRTFSCGVLILSLCISSRLFTAVLQLQITWVKFLLNHRLDIVLLQHVCCDCMITIATVWRHIMTVGMGFRFKQCALTTSAFCLLLHWICCWRIIKGTFYFFKNLNISVV